MTSKATARTRRTLRIGELAHASGLKPDTLRYYERLGLLAAAQRTAGNFRAYDAATLDRLRFIKTAQSHGLSLREIGELLGSRDRRARQMSACPRRVIPSAVGAGTENGKNSRPFVRRFAIIS